MLDTAWDGWLAVMCRAVPCRAVLRCAKVHSVFNEVFFQG